MLYLFCAVQAELSAESTADDSLIAAIASGDTDALHKLYDSVCGAVYGFALSITKNTYDAEDVLQETFLAIYSKADTYKAQGKPMAWILTIARHNALMKLRSAKRHTELDDALLHDGQALSRLESVEQKMLVSALLSTLCDEDRQIVMLRVSGLRNREIATMLSLPVGTVLSRYHRAIKKLRASIGEDNHEEN